MGTGKTEKANVLAVLEENPVDMLGRNIQAANSPFTGCASESAHPL